MIVIGSVGIANAIFGIVCLFACGPEIYSFIGGAIQKIIRAILTVVGLLPTGFIFDAFDTWSYNGSPSCSSDSDIEGCCNPTVMYFTIGVVMAINAVGLFFTGIACLICLYERCCKRDGYNSL